VEHGDRVMGVEQMEESMRLRSGWEDVPFMGDWDKGTAGMCHHGPCGGIGVMQVYSGMVGFVWGFGF
jgi:hypothetical protein